MEKTYSPETIEERWYQFWESQGYFAPGDENTSPYCIMIPPPNVTGTLHMGHAFQDTLMDLLIRYHRMQGQSTLWQAGTDHAGIATQMVVERQLAAQGKKRQDLGRDAFVARVWDWKAQSGGHITRQLRRMGASLDWATERFTMDEGLSTAVRDVFVRLYDEGLIYRGKRLVNWDPVLHTALSDLEVISSEENGSLWHLRYPLADGSASLVVATTRPETMLGDTAVAVHPDDERYQQYIGKQIELPLTGRTIPVIADEYVDPEFGTGCVKITPAHDFNDYLVGQRHNLPMINVFTISARLNENTPDAYKGMDRYEARRQVVRDLENLGLLVETRPHKLMVPRGDRSQAVVEPLLTDQWYVKIEPLAKPAIDAVEDGRIRFVPDNWRKTYFDWMYNIEDWCISRQLWWGHRIPAWYDATGKEYVGYSAEHVREKYNLPPDVTLDQDPDVLDTWFSSALWPFSTLGWPENTGRLKTFYPTSVLVTGFDIIFFWVARMIMMGIKFMDGQVPFHEVYIHGLIRDSEGQKMSKSKGNVLDPLDLIDGVNLETLVAKRTTGLMQPDMAPKIEKATRTQFPDGIPAFGTDALRFTFAALASSGRDVRFDLGRIDGYRNFCNKLWNATRYVLMSVGGTPINEADEVTLSAADRWIISLLQQLEADVNQHIQAYRFDLAAQRLHEFSWNEYCDWYLELSKPVLQGDSYSEAARNGTRRTLLRVLEVLLRLLHPFMPFITEDLWQRVAPLINISGDTIMLQPYPRPQMEKVDEAALHDIQWVKLFVIGVRRIRSEMDIAPSRALPVLLQNGNTEDERKLGEYRLLLDSLARLESVAWLATDDVAPESAIALVGDMRLLIPLAGLIDKDAELKRLDKEMEKLRKDRDKVTAKLENPQFMEKAPVDIVDKEHQRLAELSNTLKELEAQAAKIRIV